MAPPSESPRSPGSASGSSLVLSAMAGAVLGAAGLAWWLLTEAERRRRPARSPRPLPSLRPPAGHALGESPDGTRATTDTALHERVQQLNRAIDEVRRQLEELQTQP